MPILDIIKERDLEEMNLIYTFGPNLPELEKTMDKIKQELFCATAPLYYSIFNKMHVIYADISRERTHLEARKKFSDFHFEQIETPKLECISFDLKPHQYETFLKKVQLGLKADEWYIQERIDQYCREKDRKIDFTYFFFLAEYRKVKDEYRIYFATKFLGTRFK